VFLYTRQRISVKNKLRLCRGARAKEDRRMKLFNIALLPSRVTPVRAADLYVDAA
jgi:hypothetical protein